MLSSCADGPAVYAPVSDASTIDRVPNSGVYRVSPGDTLYSIAWRFGLDYRYLARLNHLTSPYAIFVGQRIRLKGKAFITKVSATSFSFPVSVGYWQWPAHGQVIGTFSEFNKGVNIKGQLNDPVFATAAGRVVYSGSGLRGYGNLIIIEHNAMFLSAYAHNNVMFVQEGCHVKAGQKIATMGSTGAQQVMLHFEIRRAGHPVNPLNYLVKR